MAGYIENPAIGGFDLGMQLGSRNTGEINANKRQMMQGAFAIAEGGQRGRQMADAQRWETLSNLLDKQGLAASGGNQNGVNFYQAALGALHASRPQATPYAGAPNGQFVTDNYGPLLVQPPTLVNPRNGNPTPVTGALPTPTPAAPAPAQSLLPKLPYNAGQAGASVLSTALRKVLGR